MTSTLFWAGSSTTDYKHVDFDPSATASFAPVTGGSPQFHDAPQSILSTLLSSALPQTTMEGFVSSSTEPTSSSWSSLLLSTLTENLTAISNSTEVLGATVNFGLYPLTDGGYVLGRCDNGSDIFNCTVQEYMEYMRGPQTLPVQQAIFVSIISSESSN